MYVGLGIFVLCIYILCRPMYTTHNLLGITVYGGISFFGMGITQTMNMACIRGHVYFMNVNAVFQI